MPVAIKISAIQAVAEEILGGPDLAGRTILIQGTGDVGVPLCKRLVEAGAKLKIADIDAARAKGIADELRAEAIAAEKVYEEACDIFAPCAVGAVLNAKTIPKLNCKGIAGSANNQLEKRQDADLLHERGILYAPDFIANAGGAVALCGLEALRMSDDYVTAKILSIRDTLKEIFKEAAGNSESPEHAAERRARRVLERGPG